MAGTTAVEFDVDKAHELPDLNREELVRYSRHLILPTSASMGSAS
jgi:hypothetical protein